MLVASIHGGRLKRYSSQWSQITQEPFIVELEIVNGYKIDFYVVPSQWYVPAETWFSAEETQIFLCELDKLLAEKVIVHVIMNLENRFLPFF